MYPIYPRNAGALLDYLIRHRLVPDDLVLPDVTTTRSDQDGPLLHLFPSCPMRPAWDPPEHPQTMTVAQARACTHGKKTPAVCHFCIHGLHTPEFWRPWRDVEPHLAWLLWTEELRTRTFAARWAPYLVEAGMRRWLLHRYPALPPLPAGHPLGEHLAQTHADLVAHRTRWYHRRLLTRLASDPGRRTWILLGADPLAATRAASFDEDNVVLLCALAFADLGPTISTGRGEDQLAAVSHHDLRQMRKWRVDRWREVCWEGPDVTDIVAAVELRPDAEHWQYPDLITALAATRA